MQYFRLFQFKERRLLFGDFGKLEISNLSACMIILIILFNFANPRLPPLF